MSSKSFEFIVPASYDGTDVKTFLRRGCALTSHILNVLRQTPHGITLCGEELRTVDRIHTGDTLVLTLPADHSDIVPVRGELEILYEDPYLLAVNKPADLTVHPTKQHQYDTLANRVSYAMQQKGESYTFRSPYRLDRDTSGIVLIAKDLISYARLRDVRKTYLAVCQGNIARGGTVDLPIGLRDDSKMVRCVRDDGQHAVTHYTVVDDCGEFTLIQLELETGRTHQIRCHMAHLGHPLAGDDLYGGNRSVIQRHALHCDTVRFTHPINGCEIVLFAPMPDDMAHLIKKEG